MCKIRGSICNYRKLSIKGGQFSEIAHKITFTPKFRERGGERERIGKAPADGLPAAVAGACGHQGERPVETLPTVGGAWAHAPCVGPTRPIIARR